IRAAPGVWISAAFDAGDRFCDLWIDAARTRDAFDLRGDLRIANAVDHRAIDGSAFPRLEPGRRTTFGSTRRGRCRRGRLAWSSARRRARSPARRRARNIAAIEPSQSLLSDLPVHLDLGAPLKRSHGGFGLRAEEPVDGEFCALLIERGLD